MSTSRAVWLAASFALGACGEPASDPTPAPDLPPADLGHAQPKPTDLAGPVPTVLDAGAMPDLAMPTNPPSGGASSGSGPVASWTACWVYDNYGSDADHLYHQGIIYDAAKNYVVLGQSWSAPGCSGSPQDTFNDYAEVLTRGSLWWFTHFPNYKYVRFIWVDGGAQVQDTGCLDYNLIGSCP